MLDFIDKKRYDEVILHSDKNPFPEPPASNQIVNHPAEFFIGRSAQLEKLNSIYFEAAKSGIPKLSYLHGAQGVGKSTLASWFIQKLGGKIKHPILLIPLETTSFDTTSLSFKKLFKIMIEEYLKSNVLYWLTRNFVVKVLVILETKNNAAFNIALESLDISIQKFSELKNDPMQLYSKNEANFLKNFWNAFESHFHEMAQLLPSRNYELIKTLLYASFSNPNTFGALSALKGNKEFDGFFIQDEIDARKAFNAIQDISRWISPTAVTLIVIDHLEAAIATAEQSYNALFSLLNQLRNMKHLMVLLSGTFDAFDKIERTINEDMNKQVENWVDNNAIDLSSLKVKEVQSICMAHLAEVYRDNKLTPSANYPLYPYSKKSIEFLYTSQDYDLRKTLETLYAYYKNMRERATVIPVISLFDAVRTFRTNRHKTTFTYKERSIILDELKSAKYTSKTRSTKIEMGIFSLLQKLDKNKYPLRNIRHEPQIGKTTKLKPDIFFEVICQDNSIKNVAIEVKMYLNAQELPPKEVIKTHSLLKKGYADLVYWHSNIPLSSVKFNATEKLKKRIVKLDNLTDEQLGYTAITCFHEELFDETSKEDAEAMLIKAGVDIQLIINRAENVEKNKGNTTNTEIQPSLEEFTESENTKQQVPEISQQILPKELQISTLDSKKTAYETDIKNLIREKSGNKYVNISNILKKISKQYADILKMMSEDDLANLIKKIGKEEGYRTTAARIYFD